MKLFKKIAKRACLFTALILLFVACQPGASGAPNSGDSEEEIEKPSNQNENTETEEATITKDPETYGESSLPDLTESSSFAGQAYCNNEKGDAIFFNTDNTVLIKEKAGSSGIMQWKKYSLFSYTYDDAAKILTAKPKGLYFGDKLYTTVEGILSNALLGTKIEAIYEGYTNVIIPEEIINYRRQEYKNRLEKGTIKFNCSIGDDNSLILEDDIKDEEEYEYEQDDLDIELEYDEIYGYRISISKGSDELNNPFIFSVEDGVFTGADYKWVFEGSTATFKKIGNFSGKIDFDYGSCYLTLTEATDDIAWGIKSLANEKKEYELNKKKKDDSENHIEKYYPILKTINFDVIGSDGLIAYKNAQTYITDESETEWSKETLKLFNTSYVEGIYSNEECTRSVIGKEILDGIKVYVKLQKCSAQDYNLTVGNIDSSHYAEITISTEDEKLIDNPLTFEAIEDGMIVIQNPKKLEYFYIRNEKTKKEVKDSVIVIEVVKGDKIALYGDTFINKTSNWDYYKSPKISCVNDCYVYGNVMSLLSSTEELTDLSDKNGENITGTFCETFKDNIHIKNHPTKNIELPALFLNGHCYESMFSGCSSLTRAPELPAMSLEYFCYAEMFKDCIGLTQAPNLPATELAWACYKEMFSGCTSLTKAPELPATELPGGLISREGGDCYEGMFKDCTSLTKAPDLPATTLGCSCYKEMFSGCKNLTTAPELPATILAEYCYYQMFYGCIKLKTVPELPALTLAKDCYQGMFQNCISIEEAPSLPSKNLTSGCYAHMFMGCVSLIKAPELPATFFPTESNYYYDSGCYAYMFYGCKNLTKAPVLPATILAPYCYSSMFEGCLKLSYVKCLATDISADRCTDDWLKNVSIEGVFETPDEDIWTKGVDGIPEKWGKEICGLLLYIDVPYKTEHICLYRDNIHLGCIEIWSEDTSVICFNDKYVIPNTSYTYKCKIYSRTSNDELISQESNLGTFTPTTGEGEISISITGGKTSYDNKTGIVSIEELPVLNVSPASAKENVWFGIGFNYDSNGSYYYGYDKTEMKFYLYDQIRKNKLNSILGKTIKLCWGAEYQQSLGYSAWFYYTTNEFFGPSYGLPGSVTIPETLPEPQESL